MHSFRHLNFSLGSRMNMIRFSSVTDEVYSNVQTRCTLMRGGAATYLHRDFTRYMRVRHQNL